MKIFTIYTEINTSLTWQKCRWRYRNVNTSVFLAVCEVNPKAGRSQRSHLGASSLRGISENSVKPSFTYSTVMMLNIKTVFREIERNLPKAIRIKDPV